MMQLQYAASIISAHKRPDLKLTTNDDDRTIYEHRLARCIYAETLGESLPAIEALCVMVKNSGRPLSEISTDKSVFESLNRDSNRYAHLLVNHTDKKFQLCLRTVKKIRTDELHDNIFGATRFHRADNLPDWATSLGSIAEIDGLLFYI